MKKLNLKWNFGMEHNLSCWCVGFVVIQCENKPNAANDAEHGI